MNNPQDEFRRALALHQRGDPDAAEQIYKSILRSQPKYFDAIFALGIVYLQREEFRAAEKQFLLAIKIDPNNGPLQNNYGSALLGLGRQQEALAAYDRAIAMSAQNIEAHYNRGNALAAMKRFEEAIASYDRSIALNPNNAQVHDNRGSALASLSRIEAALASFSRAIQLNPRHAKAYANRGGAYAQIKQYDKALEDYEKAIVCDPSLDFVASNIVAMKMHICRWDDYETDCRSVLEGIRAGTLKAEPFTLLVLPSTEEDQLKCAAQYTRDKAPAAPKTQRTSRYSHDRIRIGYVSSDLHDHPVTHLIAGMLEAHDRSRFMIHAFSTAPVKDDKYRNRISNACEVFVNAQAMGSNELSQRIRDAEIDILVDLNGHTTGSRTDIFAARSAPVQVAHLGYPGTMGADYIDYLIADRHVVPKTAESNYSEKIVCLPNSYQPNDLKRVISDAPVSRRDFGLPDEGFVFCCFNNNFKVTPDVFGVWIHLLKAVSGSALWLYCDNGPAEENLKREAERHGIPASRLVFAKKLPLEEYRAQYKLADLFVDTLYYDAHTVGSDAMWAGLPLITCTGKTFAGRVATSLLHAAGLPELVTNSLENYEKLALELATNPGKLRSIKSRLAENRVKCPLFDTARYARDIEAAYTQMWERSQKGKPPQGFEVASSG